MVRHLTAATPFSRPVATATVVDLDLTDEDAVLVEDYARYHAEGVRNLLAALNLKSPSAPRRSREGVVIDMAVYQATGSAHLATLFSAAG